MFRSILIASAFVAMSAGAAQAQDCAAEPQFAAYRTANSTIRAQYNAVERGQWRQAIHFGNEVASGRGAPGNRIAALSNLCVAYAATGELQSAIESCDAALELSPTAWRAFNNRGAVHWLAGDHAAAASDFEAAAALAAGEAEVQANSSLAQCS
jgi:tetratricopeptide (TPR) repeat protein